jgi:hypothetical protein
LNSSIRICSYSNKHWKTLVRDFVNSFLGKVYYICEKLVPGPFTKYNGCGKFSTGQYSEICNSFTYFSYFYSQRQLLVSNVQGVD